MNKLVVRVRSDTERVSLDLADSAAQMVQEYGRTCMIRVACTNLCITIIFVHSTFIFEYIKTRQDSAV